MAKYECTVTGDFYDFSNFIHNEIINGSVSASFEDGCTYQIGDQYCSLNVYERYSYAGGNRVSLSVMLAEESDNKIKVCAVTSGGSQALFFKINTWGEESFLGKFQKAVEKYCSK